MARGRKPDPDQAKKGFPNRRKSAVKKREEEAERIAALLQESAGGDVTTPPAMIDQGPLYAGAVQIWKDMAPRLARTHRLSDHHKQIFAMFCVYFADWVQLNDQLKREGETQKVKTIAGGFMIRDHPAVKRRQQCYENVLKLSAHFGLTPHDEYDLFKNQSLAAGLNPGLFSTPGQAKDKSDDNKKADSIQVGMLGNLNSVPPAIKH